MKPPPIGGLMVLLLGAAVLSLVFLNGSGCALTSKPKSQTQPMELSGEWLGMRLVPADSVTARQMGIGKNVQGVVVAEVARSPDPRASQALIVPGDVLVGVNGKKVASLAELYTLTTRLNVSKSVPLQLMRNGQPWRTVLPGLVARPSVSPTVRRPSVRPTAAGPAMNMRPQMAPQQMPAQQMAPPQMAPPQMAPQQMPAQQMAPPQMAPPQMPAQQMLPPPMGMTQPGVATTPLR